MKAFFYCFQRLPAKFLKAVFIELKKGLKNFKKLCKNCKKMLDKNAKIDYYIQALV